MEGVAGLGVRRAAGLRVAPGRFAHRALLVRKVAPNPGELRRSAKLAQIRKDPLRLCRRGSRGRRTDGIAWLLGERSLPARMHTTHAHWAGLGARQRREGVSTGTHGARFIRQPGSPCQGRAARISAPRSGMRMASRPWHLVQCVLHSVVNPGIDSQSDDEGPERDSSLVISLPAPSFLSTPWLTSGDSDAQPNRSNPDLSHHFRAARGRRGGAPRDHRGDCRQHRAGRHRLRPARHHQLRRLGRHPRLLGGHDLLQHRRHAPQLVQPEWRLWQRDHQRRSPGDRPEHLPSEEWPLRPDRRQLAEARLRLPQHEFCGLRRR